MADKSAKNENKIKLNELQEKFCHEYVVDYNGTKAAIRAGYSEKTAAAQASRLLKNVNILSRVRAIQIEEYEKMSITPEAVILKFLEIYDRCMQSVPVLAWNSNLKEYVKTDEYTFNAKGAIAALTKIGEYLAMFKGNVKLDGEIKVRKLEDLF